MITRSILKRSIIVTLLTLIVFFIGWSAREIIPILLYRDKTYQTFLGTGIRFNHETLSMPKESLEETFRTRRQELSELLYETPYDTNVNPVTITHTTSTKELDIHTILIPTEKNLPPVSAQLFIPKDIEYPAPTILFAHGHFEDNSIFSNTPDQRTNANFHALRHAEAGFVTMVVENRGTGHFKSQHKLSQMEYVNFELLKGRSYIPLVVRDSLKALEYLRSRSEVDQTRIGVAGVSLGGEIAAFISVLDPEIKATVVSNILNYYQGLLHGSEHDLFWYGILDRVGEFPQIVATIAPRQLLIQQGLHDQEIYPEGFRRKNADTAFAYLTNVYQLLGYESFVSRDLFEGGHEYHNESSIDFFKKNL